MSALHDAIQSKDSERLVRLIREGADLEAVDKFGQTALCLAVDLKHTDMVKVLLAAGANPNSLRTHHAGYKDDMSPLMIAAAQGIYSIVKMLIDAGANVNYRRSWYLGIRDNSSTLDLAIQRCRWASARLLVTAGADMTPPFVRLGKVHDWSPLMTASEWDQSELVELMLVKGADPNYTSTKFNGRDNARTALHAAARYGAAMTIRILCKYGADVNAVSQTGVRHTSLHMTVFCFDATPIATSALIAADADPFGLNSKGRTVMEALSDKDDRYWSTAILLDSRPSTFD